MSISVWEGSPDDLVARVYSAVMDLATCDECAKWDGAIFRMDDDRVAIPNPLCTCKRGCECAWIYITKAESPPLVKGTKDYR